MNNQPSHPGDLLQGPQAAALLKNREAIRRMAQSPETQKLLQMLNRQSGGGLKEAAQQAGRGNPKALMDMVDQLVKDKEGAQLVEQLKETLPK